MPLSPTHQLHLDASASHRQLGKAKHAWYALETIVPPNRTPTEVLNVHAAVCRALKNW